MSTSTSRAGWLRGALVGSCSATITIAAHAAAGGGMPTGSAFILVALMCVTTGATAGSIRLEGRYERVLGVIVALGIAQFLGHATLVVAGGHHHVVAGSGLTPSMVAAHSAAALVLGLAISAAEYLYVVSASVLCWLRLFASAAQRPVHRLARHTDTVYALKSVMLRSGLGMRAPPMAFATAA